MVELMDIGQWLVVKKSGGHHQRWHNVPLAHWWHNGGSKVEGTRQAPGLAKCQARCGSYNTLQLPLYQ